MSGYRTIPDAALDAAYQAYDDARAAGPKDVGDMLADVVTAALPHLLTDEMVERAAAGYREVSDYSSRPAMRIALEAALGGAS